MLIREKLLNNFSRIRTERTLLAEFSTSNVYAFSYPKTPHQQQTIGQGFRRGFILIHTNDFIGTFPEKIKNEIAFILGHFIKLSHLVRRYLVQKAIDPLIEAYGLSFVFVISCFASDRGLNNNAIPPKINDLDRIFSTKKYFKYTTNFKKTLSQQLNKLKPAHASGPSLLFVLIMDWNMETC